MDVIIEARVRVIVEPLLATLNIDAVEPSTLTMKLDAAAVVLERGSL